MVMIHGYRTTFYEHSLRKWRSVHFPAMTRGGLREEYIWMNFPDGLPLHDVRFFGADYRERFRIKRKRDRWQRRFLAMPAGERQVVREALDIVDRAPP